MSTIRPLERADLDAVARLHAEEMHDSSPTRVALLSSFFERTLLDNDWADPEIPSLVYVEDGEIRGFLGSNVRRMRFDGELMRMACSAHLLTHPRARSRAAGALLLRQYFMGPQDLTITDGANEIVRLMWEKLGGTTVHLCGLAYVIVLRPLELVGEVMLSRPRLRAVQRAYGPIAKVLDRAVGRVIRPRGSSAAGTQPLLPTAVMENLGTVTRGLRLVPAYDLEYLQWLFAELERVPEEQVFPDRVARGSLLAEIVRDGSRVAGWYVCHLRPGGLCRVLQLASAPEATSVVLDRLTDRATALGAAGIYGRLEPRLVAPLSQRRGLIRFGGGRMLVHSQRSELVHAVLAGDALLTRMDGEWW